MRALAVPPSPGPRAAGEGGQAGGYRVETSVYEGPFDLLLHLILREEVEIWDVSLARIVDAFVAEIDQVGSLDLDRSTEFLLVAATLIELKARRLLPGRDDIELDEELGLWEERDLLLARLVECKTFKDAAAALQGLADVAALSYPRTTGMEECFGSVVPDLLAGVTVDHLQRAFRRALVPKPVPRVDIAHLAPIGTTVRDALQELVDELPRAGTISFRRLTQGLTERLEVIVRFLAVLELFKQGLVDIDQPTTFGEVSIVWVGGQDALADSLVDAYDG